MRIGILFSSGKDSTFTLRYYIEQGWDVCCLLSMIPKNTDSYMFQTPALTLLRAQADSLQIPLLVQETLGEKEEELDDLLLLLQRAKDEFDIEGVAAGAVASDYQQERINRVSELAGLKTYAPLWHKNQESLLREMVDAGYDIRMTRIAADGLTREWLGKRLIQSDVDKLCVLHKKLGLHVGGEGGEFETIVLDGPIFAYPLTIMHSVAMESENRGELVIHVVKAGKE